MKLKLIAERNNRKVEIKLTKKEIRNLYDVLYLIDPKDLKLNKMNIKSIHRKLEHLVHDIIDEGKVYKLENRKLILESKPHYMVRKPSWK